MSTEPRKQIVGKWNSPADQHFSPGTIVAVEPIALERKQLSNQVVAEPQLRVDLQRVRLNFGYDGTNYTGYARQPTFRTVQETLEVGLQRILRTDGPVPVIVAGRTDTGVHATGQVVHLDVNPKAFTKLIGRSSRTPAQALRDRLTGVMPDDIVIYSAELVPQHFHARFSALWRRYIYRISDSVATRVPSRRYDTLWYKRHLDVDAMNQAALLAVGPHDFAAFCRAKVGSTSLRTLLDLSFERDHEGIVNATVRADAFCHNMVRALVGSLISVGEGRKSLEWFGETLASLDRSEASAVIAARGLTLVEVAYPPEREWAARGLITMRRRQADDFDD